LTAKSAGLGPRVSFQAHAGARDDGGPFVASKLDPPTSVPTTANGAPTSVASRAMRSAAEDLLRVVAAELGLAGAVEILAWERARVRAVINE
jgi:hypothetical protein